MYEQIFTLPCAPPAATFHPTPPSTTCAAYTRAAGLAGTPHCRTTNTHHTCHGAQGHGTS